MIENETGRRNLKAEHGLSFLLEADGKRILFDTGSSQAVWENAEKLGILPADIDVTVLSHNHYDHVGGLVSGLRLGLHSDIVCGENFFDEKYRAKECQGAYTDLGCGLTRKDMGKNGGKIRVCGEILQLTDHCYAVGRFKRANKWEEISNKFLRLSGKVMEPDPFEDEICLAVEFGREKSIGVITGCSHPGIVNMLETVRERFPDRRLAFAAGGIHLKDAGEERRRLTAEALRQLGIRHLWFNHCSGDLLEGAAADWGAGMQTARLRSGDCLLFD